MSKSFSVLTVSKRTGWEEIAQKSIHKQTVQPEKWVVVTEADLMFTKAPGPQIIFAPPKTRLSNLNASNNAGLKLIKTDYVIFYQDFIELPEDCFGKLLALAEPNTMVTTCTPNYDGSDDLRFTGLGEPRRCRPEEWEANVALAPMALIKELGGFEEELDNGWAYDNVHLAQRAAMLGAKFLIDETNRPKLLPHELTSKLAMPLNAQRCADDIQLIRSGQKPIRLPYLD